MYINQIKILLFRGLFFGLFVDLISDSYFGLNTIIYCLTTYLINQNANSFKLFSYLQICLFFGLSASAYVGFSQLIINLYDFSYTTLLLSLFANTIFCFFCCFSCIILSKTKASNFEMSVLNSFAKSFLILITFIYINWYSLLSNHN